MQADGTKPQRDPTIDVMKGLLVVAMVVAHSAQFFGDMQTSRFYYVSELANLVAFPGFFFCFGFACQRAYFRDPDHLPWNRVLATTLKILLGFYASGIYVRLFWAADRPWLRDVPMILLLRDIPPYSEFLVAFALMILAAALLARPIDRILRRPWSAAALMAGLLLATFIPYSRVRSPYLALLVGTTQFPAFPIVQYAPLFLAGMYWARRRSPHRVHPAVIAVAAALSLAFCIWIVQYSTQTRFPPSTLWILASGSGAYLGYLGARSLLAVPGRQVLVSMGQNVLFYLIASNVIFFSTRGRFHRPAYRSWECVLLACGVLAAIYFATWIIAPAGTAPSRRPTAPEPASTPRKESRELPMHDLPAQEVS